MTKTIETRWWFVRHAPVPNPEARCYGQHDMDCDVSNAAAFESLARRLPTEAVWMATTLKRTQLTMNAIHAARGSKPDPLHLERELIEQSFGGWQGRTYAELGAFGRGDPGAPSHRFWLAPAHSVPPGGESFVQVMQRVGAAVQRLTQAHRGRDIVCVAHGGSIRAALALAVGLEPEAALAFSIETLSLTRLDHIDGPGTGHGWRVGPINMPPL